MKLVCVWPVAEPARGSGSIVFNLAKVERLSLITSGFFFQLLKFQNGVFLVTCPVCRLWAFGNKFRGTTSPSPVCVHVHPHEPRNSILEKVFSMRTGGCAVTRFPSPESIPFLPGWPSLALPPSILHGRGLRPLLERNHGPLGSIFLAPSSLRSVPSAAGCGRGGVCFEPVAGLNRQRQSSST